MLENASLLSQVCSLSFHLLAPTSSLFRWKPYFLRSLSCVGCLVWPVGLLNSFASDHLQTEGNLDGGCGRHNLQRVLLLRLRRTTHGARALVLRGQILLPTVPLPTLRCGESRQSRVAVPRIATPTRTGCLKIVLPLCLVFIFVVDSEPQVFRTRF